MRTLSAGLSHVGLRRSLNEDCFVCDDDAGLYVVADGVGGHAKGEVASHEAVEELVGWVRRHRGEIDAALGADEDGARRVRRLVESGVQSACYLVYALAEQDPDKRGMSTTMSCLLVRGGRAFVAQVGDSRVYRLRGERLEQLTEDHTLATHQLRQGLITAEEARKIAGRNVITRAVGHRDYVQVDTTDADAAPGDRYFLCTDGFHGYVEDDREVVAIARLDPEEAVQRAVDLANSRGGRDNVTAVLVTVTS